jgi:hypothetical protein
MYYQWKWEKTRMMEGGTFFSVLDFLDEIKAPQMLGPIGSGLPTIARAHDHDAKDSGQYGVGLTYVLPWLESTEAGLYYINYHDKNPTLNIDLGYLAGGLNPPSYFLSFTEDIKLYGVSISSMVGDTNVSGEFSYRQNLGLNAANPSIKGNYWQAQASIIYTKRVPFCDTLTLLGEVACGREIGLADDTFAWTYVIAPSLSWDQVLPYLDMKLNLAYSDTPSGTNPLGTEGVSSGSLGVDATYKLRYTVALKYENRFNTKRNPYSDRDTIAFTMSYTF